MLMTDRTALLFNTWCMCHKTLYKVSESEWMVCEGASQCGGGDAGPHRGGALLPVWHGQLECICRSGHALLPSLPLTALLLPDLEPMHACMSEHEMCVMLLVKLEVLHVDARVATLAKLCLH